MRERYHTELESAVRQIREQQEQSEATAGQFRQKWSTTTRGMHTVCQRQGEGEQERDGILRRTLRKLIMNNEMVVEHGRQAVALRDETCGRDEKRPSTSFRRAW